MSEGIWVALWLLPIIIVQMAERWRLQDAHDKRILQMCKDWNLERADLLSRIQAGSYAEYKTQEIRLVKAQNQDEKPSVIEQM